MHHPLTMNPYSVLRITESCSTQDVRNAYKKALLRNHPDTSRGAAEYTIDQVNLAYRTIIDSLSGGKSASVELNVQFSDVQDLSQFDYNEQDEYFFCPCRCGQDMVVTVEELESNGDADEIAVQCSGCSLWVLVQYDVEEGA